MSREDNPELDISRLEAFGFIGCLEDPKTHKVLEWVKSTDKGNAILILELKKCGVSKYTVGELKDEFRGLNHQIKVGYLDAITSRPCPPMESKPIFKDYDLNSEPRIRPASGTKTTGTIAVTENDLPEIK